MFCFDLDVFDFFEVRGFSIQYVIFLFGLIKTKLDASIKILNA